MSAGREKRCQGCGQQTTARGHFCPTCYSVRTSAGLISDGPLWDRIDAELADTLEAEWVRRHAASHGYDPGSLPSPSLDRRT